MDLVRGLTFAVLSFFFAHSALAASTFWTVSNLSPRFLTASDACNAGQKALGYPGGVLDGTVCNAVGADNPKSVASDQCPFNLVPIGSRQGYTIYDCTEGPACPAGSTLGAGGVCSEVNDCPPAGTVEGTSDNTYKASSITPTICIGEGTKGCVWKPGGIVSSGCMNGVCYQSGPFTATGATCNPSSTVPGAPASAASTPQAEATCVSKGQCPGTVNGTQVCVPCSSKEQTTVESTATAASSAASGGAPSSTGGSSETTEKTTKCEAGVCVTTEKKEVKDADGSTKNQTTTKQQPQTSFCAENPKAAVCKGDDDSTWGGTCASGFQCKGDAVQCAQAQASWKSACAFDVEDSDPHRAVGLQVMNGTLPDADPTKLEGAATDLSNSIDQTNPYAAICPSDVQIAIGSYGSFAIPISTVCPYFEFMGYAAVACALAVAAKIALGTT